jgi:hypothetical protein
MPVATSWRIAAGQEKTSYRDQRSWYSGSIRAVWPSVTGVTSPNTLWKVAPVKNETCRSPKCRSSAATMCSLKSARQAAVSQHSSTSNARW